MYYVMDELREKIMDFDGGIYQERVKEKPEFYQYIQKELEENFSFQIN